MRISDWSSDVCSSDLPQPDFNETVEVDLDEIVPSIAGPKRPQDRINLPEVARAFEQDVMPGSAELPEDGAPVESETWTLDHGHVVIAAITSCTNPSNQSVMLAAGPRATNADERGRPAHGRGSRREGQGQKGETRGG